MPKYRFTGNKPVRYGGLPVKNGDVIDASAHPGHNFELAEEKAPPKKKAPSSQQSETVKAGDND